MANHAWDQNYGYVARLYPEPNKVYFSLKDGKTAMNPKYGYYFVPKAHPNYDAMVALLYMAADSRYVIYARTKESLVNGFAEVIYFVINW